MSPVATHAFHLEKLEKDIFRFIFFCCIVTIKEFIAFTISLYSDFLAVKDILSKYFTIFFFLSINVPNISFFMYKKLFNSLTFIHIYCVQSSLFDLNTTFDKIITWLKWHKHNMRTKFSLYFTARIKNNDENCHIFACFVHLTLISTFIFYLSQQFSTHIYLLLPHKKNILLLQSTQCGFCNNAYLIEELALAILHLFKLVIISLQNIFTTQNEVEYK